MNVFVRGRPILVRAVVRLEDGVSHGLVERAQQGDQDAFARLVDDSSDRLYRVAYRILRDPDDARDATQQALLEAWRDLPSLRDAERWEAWSYRLVVHACYRQRRRAQGGTVRLLPSDAVHDDVARAVAERDEIERGFRGLTAEHRAVVVLHHFVGLPLTEVADVLGVPAGTARSRLHHATRRLRRSFDGGRVDAPRGEQPA